MKTTFMTLAVILMAITGISKTKTNTKSTIIIVPGAWSDPSAWVYVTPAVKAKGFDVVTVNLPGHGQDNTSFANISLRSYVEAVKNAIGDKTNVILVGHSMAGLVISQVAEEIPDQIRKLVYVAAFLPKNGESLLSLAQTDMDSHVGKYLQIDNEAGAIQLFPALPYYFRAILYSTVYLS